MDLQPPYTEAFLKWRRPALVAIFLSVLIRLVYLGGPELIPEEAYYWLYSRHLDWGYLDHPPLTAWLIWLGTFVFGQNEFGVRSGAFLCWIPAAYFVFKFSEAIFSRAHGVLALMMFSSLTFFFAIGLTIAPDSGLVACWAGALYFLERALLRGRKTAWYAAGACFGLGMLSKYTIVLAGAATLIFCALDKGSRHWFRRKEPYLAALLALLLFSPVIYWNMINEWASFVFQGPRRLEMPSKFALHQLLLDMVVLAGPAAVLAALLFFRDFFSKGRIDHSKFFPQNRSAGLFVVVFALVPLAVFALYSLRHSTKLNWTGPAFLALLPCLAQQILAVESSGGSLLERLILRIWLPVVYGLLLTFWIVLHYVSYGIPFIPYGSNMGRFIGWESLGEKVYHLALSLENQHGEKPVVVALDKHNIASELSFYLRRAASEHEAVPPEVLSRGIFGYGSLMFAFWDQGKAVEGKLMLLVARNKRDLDDSILASSFGRLGPYEEISTENGGKPVGRYYYRVGEDFRAAPPQK